MMWANAGQFVRCGACSSDVESSSLDDSASDNDDSASDADDSNCSSQHSVPDTLQLSRRQRKFGDIAATDFTASPQCHLDEKKVRDISAIQLLLQEHTETLAALYPVTLWRILGAVMDQSKAVQTKVLKAVSALLSSVDRKSFIYGGRAPVCITYLHDVYR